MYHYSSFSLIRCSLTCLTLALSVYVYGQCGPTPIVYNGFAIALPSSGSVVVDAQLFDAGSIDGCNSGSLTFSFSSDVNDTFRTFDCNDSPDVLVDIWVTDMNGNQNFANTYAILQNFPPQCPPTIGTCGPAAIAYNGLALDISAGPVTLLAQDIDAGSLDVCNSGSLTYEIAPAESGAYGAGLVIDCNSDPLVMVNLRVTDDFGNQSIAETYVLINDGQGFCSGNSPITPCGPTPFIMNGLAIALPPGGTAALPASSVFLGFADGCNNGNIQTTIARGGSIPDFGSTSVAVDCSDAGSAILIDGFIQDDAGSITFASTFVLVQDNLSPQMTCIGSGLTVEIQPPGFVSIGPEDYFASLVDNCNVQLSFSSDPNDNSRVFSCLDLGLQPLTIWATDDSGNQTSCMSEVTIQGNLVDCDICTGDQYDLGGVIATDYYRASDYIYANGQIGQRVVFQATNSIILYPGFSAPAGTNFTALIAPCTPPPPAPFVATVPSLAEADESMEVRIFPNPFSDQSKIEIDVPGDGPLRVYLTDLSGKVLTNLADFDSFSGAFWEGQLQKALPGGIYFLHVANAKEHQIHKMIATR